MDKGCIAVKDSLPMSCVLQINVRVSYPLATLSVFPSFSYSVPFQVSSLRKAALQLGLLFVGFPPQQSGFSSKSGQMGFEVDKVTLGWLSLYTSPSPVTSYSINLFTFTEHPVIRR
jgi:hypothetical protein